MFSISRSHFSKVSRVVLESKIWRCYLELWELKHQKLRNSWKKDAVCPYTYSSQVVLQTGKSCDQKPEVSVWDWSVSWKMVFMPLAMAGIYTGMNSMANWFLPFAYGALGALPALLVIFSDLNKSGDKLGSVTKHKEKTVFDFIVGKRKF